jgi:hypothetical protein
MVTYNSAASRRFYLTTYTNSNSLKSAISSSSYSFQSSQDLTNGLYLARTDLFTATNGDRIGVQNIAIVLANGMQSTDITLLRNELNNMLRAGIKIFSVGLSSKVNSSFVQMVSSLPQRINTNYFISDTISSLSQLASPNSVSQQVCLAADADCSRKVVDIVFVMTSSSSVGSAGWSNEANFVADLIAGFNVALDATHIAVVRYGNTADTILNLTASYSASSIASLVRSTSYNSLGTGHNIQTALNYVQSTIFASSEDRSDVLNVIVLITDSASSSDSTATIQQAKRIRGDGTKIFTVGVSSTRSLNITELHLIASAPHLEYHQWWTVSDMSSLDSIKTNLENELCRPQYEMYCLPTEYDGYQCFCPYSDCDIRPINGTNCTDIDECAINNGGCQHLCSNSIGSYACGCLTGFKLASDSRFCEDVNECLLSTTCSLGRCINSFGGYYCITNSTLISTGEYSALEDKSSEYEVIYSPTTLIIAIVISVVITILVTATVWLVVRSVLRQQSTADTKQPVSHGGGYLFGTISSWGFNTVRSDVPPTQDSLDDNVIISPPS